MIRQLSDYQHKRGIERETLRILKNGTISLTPHPHSLGSKLTHENITVDFSESLLELITEPFDSIDLVFDRLQNISVFCTKNIPSNEILLNTSMPLSTADNKIKIADFGSSNSGKMKEIYRIGLANRYGKIMQAISGIHYNFSFDPKLMSALSEEKSLSSDALYFSTINHYFDFMWLLPYLFGSSPICAKTSVQNKPDYLEELNNSFYIGKYSTSLRMSGLGYQSNAQSDLFISYDNVKDYASDLVRASQQNHADFERIGLEDGKQRKQQLNTCILQIENEYYSSIRPKQIVERCERPACALINRGVRYIEVRVLDANPFDPLGIDKTTAYFTEAMLMTCLLLPTKKYAKQDVIRNNENFRRVVEQGRNPMLQLNSKETTLERLQTLGFALLDQISETAETMGKEYIDAVKAQYDKIKDPTQTPSAKVAALGKTYAENILDLSKKNTQSLRDRELSSAENNAFLRQVKSSLQAQTEIEENDCCSLDEYIKNYGSSTNNN